MKNTTKTIGDVTIRSYLICGTKVRIYEAWERDHGDHRVITHAEDGTRLGRIGSRDLPRHLDALKPGSDERYNAVKAWHAAQYEEAYAAIFAAYPELANVASTRDMGEISVMED